MCKHYEIFQRNMAPAYADEIFQSVDQSRVTRRSKSELNLPFRKSSACQKCPSYMGPKIWNSLSSDLKSTNSINSLNTRSRKIFSKIYRERKKTYMGSTKTAHPPSLLCFGLTKFLIYTKAHTIMFIIFFYNHL